MDTDFLELPDVLEDRIRAFYEAEYPRLPMGDVEYWHRRGIRVGES